MFSNLMAYLVKKRDEILNNYYYLLDCSEFSAKKTKKI